MKTIFITGASSGIGKATAQLFQSKGWNVIAAVRKPDAEEELSKLENVLTAKCDVMDLNSIKVAISEGIKQFGSIDVLVNNAGYYILGPMEAAAPEQIKRQLDTNLLGTIQVTKEMIPHFREQRSGTIINISSIAGVIALPMQSLYHATKWGVEGFSESLQFELRQFGIRIKIIEPGIIKTDFYGRSMTMAQDKAVKEYDSYFQKVLNNVYKSGEKGSSPEIVAQAIFKASTDNRKKMRYQAGILKEMVHIRKWMPQRFFTGLVRSVMEK